MMLIKPNIAWFFTWFHPNLCSNFCQILLNLQTFQRKLWGRPQTWVCFEWAAALHLRVHYTLLKLRLKLLFIWKVSMLISRATQAGANPNGIWLAWCLQSLRGSIALILSDRDTADKSNVIFTLNKHQDLQSSSPCLSRHFLLSPSPTFEGSTRAQWTKTKTGDLLISSYRYGVAVGYRVLYF